MLMYVIKVVVSALLIVLVTEISKKDNLLASIVISIPWLSFITILWIFIETKDAAKVALFSSGVFWMVIPSRFFFVVRAVLLKQRVNFYAALLVSTTAMTLLYFGMNAALKHYKIV